MNVFVSKKRLLLAGGMAVVCLLLLATHMDLFLVRGRISEPRLSIIMLLLFGGCYVQSARFELPKILNGLWIIAAFLALPYVMVYLIEYLAGQDAASLTSDIFWLNYFWCQVVYLLLFAVTNQYRCSIVFGSVICFVTGAVNYFVLLFRSSPFQLTDILSIGTAADVVGNYVISLNYDLLWTGSIAFFAICVACVAEFRQKRRHWYSFVGTLVLLAMLVVSVNQFYEEQTWTQHGLTMNFWNPLQSYEENGTALSLAMAGKYLRPEKPEHYSAKLAEDIMLAGIQTEQAVSDAEAVSAVAVASGKQDGQAEAAVTTGSALQEKPNIIAIMNESYSDLSILGDFKTSVPYMSFYQSLQKNTIRGNLSVSVLGGGTCNSEFEFLTGLSMAFLPVGRHGLSAIYQQRFRQLGHHFKGPRL